MLSMALSYLKSMCINAYLLAAQNSGTCNRFSNPVKQAHLRGTEPREGGEVHSIVTVWDQVLGRGQRERITWIDLGRGCLQHRFRRKRISTRSTINRKS